MGAETVTVPDTVYGYPGMAFGGYVAGLLARHAGASELRVDFHRPVPLGRPVGIGAGARARAESWVLTDGNGPLATGRPLDRVLDWPAPPTLEQAAEATTEFARDAGSAYPDCFGCGHDRSRDRGLRQFTGRVPGRPMVAAEWVPGSAFTGEGASNVLATEYVWAALDCPGAWARLRLIEPPVPMAVTASLSATVRAPVHAEQPHVVFGWLVERTGRKATVGSAIVSAEGEVCAVAEALWVDRRPA